MAPSGTRYCRPMSHSNPFTPSYLRRSQDCSSCAVLLSFTAGYSVGLQFDPTCSNHLWFGRYFLFRFHLQSQLDIGFCMSRKCDLFWGKEFHHRTDWFFATSLCTSALFIRWCEHSIYRWKRLHLFLGRRICKFCRLLCSYYASPLPQEFDQSSHTVAK